MLLNFSFVFFFFTANLVSAKKLEEETFFFPLPYNSKIERLRLVIKGWRNVTS